MRPALSAPVPTREGSERVKEVRIHVSVFVADRSVTMGGVYRERERERERERLSEFSVDTERERETSKKTYENFPIPVGGHTERPSRGVEANGGPQCAISGIRRRIATCCTGIHHSNCSCRNRW